MKIYLTTLAIVLSLCLSNVSGQDNVNSPMNVLFIAVDDLKPTLGCYGDTLAITPNIDSLAERGLLFSAAYCQQAVCAPSRASLLTSRYPDQTRVEDLQTMLREVSPGIVSLPEYLIENGFITSATGKIFDFRSVDNELDAPSWSVPYRKHYDEVYYDQQNGKPSYYYASAFSKDTIAKLRAEAVELGVDINDHVKEHYHPAVESADVAYDGYVDGAILNAGIELLDELANYSDPFFLGVGFHRPHLPFVAPTKFWDLYDRTDFSMAPYQKKAKNSPDIAYHNFNELRGYTDIPGSGDLDNNKQLELIHGYYAAASYIDHLVGMLIRRLEQLQIADSTIIILWGDHGWHLGDHNLWCKHSNFEQATRVPMVISYPGQPNTGAIADSPVEFTDIAPTLCDLTGIEIPQFFEGESLVPLINDPTAGIREAALSQYPRWGGVKGYSIRSKRYRYTKWLNDDGTVHAAELYDYEADPLETVSFVSDPAYQHIVVEMDSILEERIAVPSTQTKIRFFLQGINDENDSLDIQYPSITFHKEKQEPGYAGIITFTHLPGNYNYVASGMGFSEVSGEISVQNDTLVELLLYQEKYNVEFEVRKAWNGEFFEGVDIHFAGQQGTTDETGLVNFKGITFDQYTIEAGFFEDQVQVFENTEIFSDTSIVLYIEQPVYEISFEVTDLYSGNGISNVAVSLNGKTSLTDRDGATSLSDIEGTYSIALEKEYYSTKTDEVEVNSDVMLNYELEPTHNDARIWIKDEGAPVNEASVSLDSLQIITTGLGLAHFEYLPVHQHYTYMVSKEGFDILQGTFYLHSDTSFNIELVPAALHSFEKGGNLMIRPNPVIDKLYIYTPVDENGTINIFAMDGKKVLDLKTEQGEMMVCDVHHLTNRLYCIVYRDEKEVRRSLFIRAD
ncbi:MAG: sulfatase-like hydrolase/transferase [Bacteroidales bacterium]|nr:sulfatase-like hydrolase/transferase [Bacteroidales bacterium]